MLLYDFGSQILTVNVTHEGQNKNDYIETIEILKNDISVLNRTYTNQTGDWGMLDTFSVSAVVGDNLTVTATCSKGYSITRWLVVTSTITTTTTNTTTTTTTQPTSSSTTTESTTEATNNTDSQGVPMNVSVAIGVVVVLIIFFIFFLMWLKPEYAPDALKNLGSRLKQK